MYSPNCRLAVGVKNSVGMKREKLYAKAVNYAGLAGSVSRVALFAVPVWTQYDEPL